MMYYCDQCAKIRGFPITNKTAHSQQCDFCDRHIIKCNIGNYVALVGLDINPEVYETDKGSIKIHQMVNLPGALPITKIHEKDRKLSLSSSCILTFPATAKEDGKISIFVTNRKTGEQVCIKM